MRGNDRFEQRKRTRRIALCGVFSALGVVLLCLGSLIEVLDLSTAAIASLLCVLVMIEYGGFYPWSVYASTALLSLLLAPQKSAALIYALFGFYPIVKAYLERLPRVGCVLVKCGIFALLEVLLITLGDVILGVQGQMPWFYYAALYALGFLTLWLYDVLVTRLVTRYLLRWRERIKKLF